MVKNAALAIVNADDPQKRVPVFRSIKFVNKIAKKFATVNAKMVLEGPPRIVTHNAKTTARRATRMLDTANTTNTTIATNSLEDAPLNSESKLAKRDIT